jgi:hypothetical protein
MALPCGTTGSLYPPFGPARLVGLTVKHPSAIALCVRLPSVLRVPLKASVIVLEATTPVKLPTKQCPPLYKVRLQATQGPYFKDGSTTPGDAASQPPAYPTHELPRVNAKL